MSRQYSSSFFHYFRPNLFISNILDLNVKAIVNNKIKMVIFDLDNTLAPHFSKRATRYARLLIQQLKQHGLIVVVASNNTKSRVLRFCETLPELDDVIWNAFKPFPFKLQKLFDKFSVLNYQTVIIGDQFITDIWVANILKTRSILVTSLFDVRISDEVKKNSFKYFIENYIYKRLQYNNFVNNHNNLADIILGADDEIL